MVKLEDLGEVISTDVLIIGGGLGGLVAAIKAKEDPVEVLLVDKQTIGWSGKAPKVGGGLWVMLPDDDADKIAEYHIRNIGFYLNDQELLHLYARESFRAVEQLAEWGVKLARDAEGKLQTARHPANLWSGTGVDRDMLLPLRAKARKMGAKILNKVQVVELLKQGDRVVGAVGFNIIDGRFYIFKAKATVLANGSCNYRVKRMWVSGCGDGIAAAFRAGAEMRNAEFGNFFDVDRKDTDLPAPSGAYSFLFNALGENLSERYVTKQESDTPISIILGMEKEVNEGRGPIYMDPSRTQWDMTKPPPFFAGRWGMPKILDFWRLQEAKQLKYGTPPSARVEVAAALNAELSPIKVDHEMKTSLAGLWAIGDTCYQGSAWAGAVPAPPGRLRGSGVMNTLFTSLRGGPSAARFASKGASPEVDSMEVKRFKEDIFAPMRRDKGFLPADAIYAIQDVVCKVKYNLRRSKDRLEEALSKIEEVNQRLHELCAKGGHDLGKCHEAKSMALCAEMTFRAALMRTESRGSHFREDYPERDDKNWLTWIIVKQEAGKMVISTEPVPIDNYKIKPY
jgi:succinate dehydrogenase / fumarate reductase flavoprotein subunit